MPFASINGQEIFYSDVGTGPAVVLAHGYLMDHTMFQPQVDALTPEFRLITWDERGFGQTVHDGKPFSYYDSASDCLGLMTHLGLESAIIGGHSQGGYLSLRAALLAPARVKALILIDTQARAEDNAKAEGNQKLTDAWISVGPTLEVSPGVTIAKMVAGIILDDPVQDEIWMAKWIARPREGVKEPSHCLWTRDCIAARMPEIKCPCFIVHGTNDSAITLECMQEMADALPAARPVLLIQGAAHAPNLTHADQVNPPLLAFLLEISATA